MSETASPLKQRLQADMKTAMKSGEKATLAVIRLIIAAIKQREIDERISLDDEQIVAVLDKMRKQRRESITQYSAAGRDDLVAQEASEIQTIELYLPPCLSESEIQTMIHQAITDSGARSIQDMGKVMARLKPLLQGRADMAEVSAAVKKQLGAA